MDCDALAGEYITGKCWEYINGKCITNKWTAYDAMTTKYIANECIAGVATIVSTLLISAESALLVSVLLVSTLLISALLVSVLLVSILLVNILLGIPGL